VIDRWQHLLSNGRINYSSPSDTTVLLLLLLLLLLLSSRDLSLLSFVQRRLVPANTPDTARPACEYWNF